jgi:hypothetical protein
MSTTTLGRRVEQLDREIKDRQAERADTTTDTIAALAAGREA